MQAVAFMAGAIPSSTAINYNPPNPQANTDMRLLKRLGLTPDSRWLKKTTATKPELHQAITEHKNQHLFSRQANLLSNAMDTVRRQLLISAYNNLCLRVCVSSGCDSVLHVQELNLYIISVVMIILVLPDIPISLRRLSRVWSVMVWAVVISGSECGEAHHQ